MNSLQSKYAKAGNLVFNLLLIYAVTGLFSGHLLFLDTNSTWTILPGKSWKIALAAVGLIVLAAPLLSRVWNFKLSLMPQLFLLGLILILISDYMVRRFAFYAYHAHYMIFPASIVALGIVLSVFCLLLSRKTPQLHLRILFSPFTLLLFQIVITALFINFVDHRLIISDDHPSFLYRLQQTIAHFPELPFYNTQWNAGVLAFEPISTGALNLFYLSWPLLKVWGDFTALEDAEIYTYLLPYLFVLLIPWSVVIAARILGYCLQSSVAAGILSLGPSLLYFEWFLKYGTMGFSIAAGLSVLAFALCARLVIKPYSVVHWRTVLAASIVTSLCFFWMLSFVFFIPLAFYALLNFKTTFAPDRRWKIAVFVFLVFALNGPWVLTYLRTGNVVKIVSRSTLPGSHTSSFHHHDKAVDHHEEITDAAQVTVPPNVQSKKKQRTLSSKVSSAYKHFCQMLTQINPLIILLFLPGLFCFAGKNIRLLVGSTIAWLLIVAAFSEFYKPQLELRRMIIPAGFFMALLAGSATVSILRELYSASGVVASSSWFCSKGMVIIQSSVLLGMFFITPINIAHIYLSHSDHYIMFFSNEAKNFVSALRSLDDRGRVFFAGFTLHDFGASSSGGIDGGHVAPLPYFTGKSFYASSFVHNRWSPVDPIPVDYLNRGMAGIEEFLDLINVSAVASYKAKWHNYFSSQLNYSLVYSDQMVKLYSRNSENQSYFLVGDGEIIAIKDNLIELAPASEETVIKFRYYPQLKVFPEQGITIEPYPAFIEELGGDQRQEVDFIKLKLRPELVAKQIKLTIKFR